MLKYLAGILGLAWVKWQMWIHNARENILKLVLADLGSIALRVLRINLIEIAKTISLESQLWIMTSGFDF